MFDMGKQEQVPEVVKRDINKEFLQKQRPIFLEQLHDKDSQMIDYITEKRKLEAQLKIVNTNIEATKEDQDRLRGVMAFIDSHLEDEMDLEHFHKKLK